jgi:hypothetical protein
VLAEAYAEIGQRFFRRSCHATAEAIRQVQRRFDPPQLPNASKAARA